MFVRYHRGIGATAVSGKLYDLWSLGITIMEICNDGTTFLSGLPNNEAIKDRLAFIRQEEIDKYINDTFGNNKGVRNVLRSILKVQYSSSLCIIKLVDILCR